jgi:hypothetical protein
MTDWDRLADRRRKLHPRVSVGNDTPCWLKPRRTIYGPTLDGSYHGVPRCRSFEGALRKAEKLSRELQKQERAS